MFSGTHYHNVPIALPRPIRLLFVAEAPPEEAANYFYHLADLPPSAWPGRSFFWGMVRGVGLAGPGDHRTKSEMSLLKEFFAKGFFLIDASPVAIPNKPSNFVMDPGPVKKSLFAEVDCALQPERLVFAGKSTQAVLNAYRDESGQIPLLRDEPLPYPGSGWLTRPCTGDGFLELFCGIWPPPLDELLPDPGNGWLARPHTAYCAPDLFPRIRSRQ